VDNVEAVKMVNQGEMHIMAGSVLRPVVLRSLAAGLARRMSSGVFTALLAGLALLPLQQAAQAKPAPVPARNGAVVRIAGLKIDDSNFPIISVDAYLGSGLVKPDTILKAAEVVRQVANSVEANRRWHLAKAINFSFSVGPSQHAARNFMFLTEDISKMRSLTALHRAAPAYLTIARDGRVVDVADERAAKAYCSGTSIGFCSRYSY
jgi:hypothetical protein